MPFASINVTPSQIGSYISIDVTAAVQRWADGSLSPQGFRLATGDTIRALFSSKEIGPAPILELVSGDGGNGDRPGILDFSASLPVVIDEPGEYALDRNWSLGTSAGYLGSVLRVEADGVRIDFEGHVIRASHQGSVIEILGDNVTLRNGRLFGDLYQVVLRSEGDLTHIDRMEIHSEENIALPGAFSSIRDSRLVTKAGVHFGDYAVVERSRFDACRVRCLNIGGVGAVIRGNEFSIQTNSTGEAVRIAGDDSVFTDNLFDQRYTYSAAAGLVVNGASNRILDNTIIQGENMLALIVINGTGNTIDNNVSAPETTGTTANQGLVFSVDGNFYGDNRLHAVVPFVLNGTLQTDWGGNTGY
jgi:hypothetical protein